MGSSHCSNTSVTTVTYHLNSSISPAIEHYISSAMSEAYTLNASYATTPFDLIILCMEYIGFIMISDILTHNEQYSLWEMLLPLFPKVSCTLKYFDLLYHSAIDGQYCNKSLLSKIRYKSNIVIVYRTNFGHVFAVYLQKADYNLDSTQYPWDKQFIECFVLRSNLRKPEKLKISTDEYSLCYVTERGSIACVSLEFEPNDNLVTLGFGGFSEKEKAKEICGGSITINSDSPFYLFTVECCEAFQLF